MLLGFISLLLTVGTRAILKICIPEKYEKIMLPCKNAYGLDKYEDKSGGKGGGGGDNKRKLLSFAGNVAIHRVLAAAGGDGGDYCSKVINKTNFFQLIRINHYGRGGNLMNPFSLDVVIGQSVFDFANRSAPIAHISICSCHFSCSVQCHYYGARASKSKFQFHNKLPMQICFLYKLYNESTRKISSFIYKA